MEATKIVLGYAAALVAVFAYAIYIANILKGSTKPHVFSWFIWSLLAGLVFAEQLVKGAGAGSWVTGLSAIAGFLITGLGLFKGERSFSLADWLFLAGTLIAMAFWLLIDNVTLSAEMATLVALLGYAPTLRKGWQKPDEDMSSSFALNALKYFFAVLALQKYSLVTALYPMVCTIMNGVVAVLLLLRRQLR